MNLAHRTIHNVLFNLLGWLWPIGLSLLATPYIVRHLGKDAYGVLALVWAVLGYFALLDLGLSAATIKYISKYHALGDYEKVRKVINSNLLIFVIIGVGGGAILAGITPFLLDKVLLVPPSLIPLTRFAFYVGAAGFLFTMSLGVLTAIPNALQRYDISNLVGIVITTATTLGTVGLLAAGYWLREVVLWNLFLSVLSVALYIGIARHLLPEISWRPGFDWPTFRESLNFGSMALIQRISGAILFQLDRLLIGAFLGTAAVTFYVVPANLTQRIHGIVSRTTQVIFPVSSALQTTNQGARLQQVYLRSAKFGAMAGSALAVPFAVLSFPFLRYWMGPEFARQGSTVLTILAASYYLSSLTAVPSSTAHGIGRPDVNAAFASSVAILNVTLCLILIPRWGLVGAAYANLFGVVLVVPAFLFFMEHHLLQLETRLVLRKVYLGPTMVGAVVILFGAFVIAPQVRSLGIVLVGFLLCLALYGLLALLLGIIDREARLFLWHYLSAVPRRLWSTSLD